MGVCRSPADQGHFGRVMVRVVDYFEGWNHREVRVGSYETLERTDYERGVVVEEMAVCHGACTVCREDVSG